MSTPLRSPKDATNLVYGLEARPDFAASFVGVAMVPDVFQPLPPTLVNVLVSSITTSGVIAILPILLLPSDPQEKN